LNVTPPLPDARTYSTDDDHLKVATEWMGTGQRAYTIEG